MIPSFDTRGKRFVPLLVDLFDAHLTRDGASSICGRSTVSHGVAIEDAMDYSSVQC